MVDSRAEAYSGAGSESGAGGHIVGQRMDSGAGAYSKTGTDSGAVADSGVGAYSIENSYSR